MKFWKAVLKDLGVGGLSQGHTLGSIFWAPQARRRRWRDVGRRSFSLADAVRLQYIR